MMPFGQVMSEFSVPFIYAWGILRRFAGRHPRIFTVIKFALVFALFWMVGWQRLDPDFGWHLQAGNYIRGHGIPGHDIYSYTASQFRWIDHEWGYDVILSYLYNMAHGWAVMCTFFAALWTTTLIVADRKATAFVLLVSAFALAPYSGIRPTVFTILFFIILLKLSKIKRPWINFAIPLLFVVWANLHGGLIVGLLALIYFAFRDRQLRWIWVLAASILASFLNPYGPHLYEEIARTLLDSQVHFQIQEWYYFTIYKPSMLFVALWLFGFWLFAKDPVLAWIKKLLRRPGADPDVKIGDHLIGPFTLAMAMSATRNMPLFVVATSKDLGEYLKKTRALIPKNLNKASLGVLAIFALGILYWLYVSWPQTFYPLSLVRGSGYPSQAASYISTHGCDGGNLFNSYDYGGYLIWKLPTQKIYIDGRMPVWRDQDGKRYMDRYFKVLDDKSYQEQQFKQYNIRCVLVEPRTTNQKLLKNLKSKGWKEIKHTGTGQLFVAPRSN